MGASKKPKTLVTADIIRKLRDLGITNRAALLIFHRIIDEMKQALKQGEEVEWPFGSLKKVHQPQKPNRGWFLHKITTTYKKPFTVALVEVKEIRDPGILEKEQEEKRRQFLEARIKELRKEHDALRDEQIKLIRRQFASKFSP